MLKIPIYHLLTHFERYRVPLPVPKMYRHFSGVDSALCKYDTIPYTSNTQARYQRHPRSLVNTFQSLFNRPRDFQGSIEPHGFSRIPPDRTLTNTTKPICSHQESKEELPTPLSYSSATSTVVLVGIAFTIPPPSPRRHEAQRNHPSRNQSSRPPPLSFLVAHVVRHRNETTKA